MAIAAGGLLGFVVVASGVWHSKIPASGLTQVDRHASITLADGSVVELSEPETDLDILRRRRMRGWQGKEYRQVFIMADGREMNVLDNRPGVTDEGEDLSAGDHLILAAYTPEAKDDSSLAGRQDNTEAASLQIDGKVRPAADAADEKDRVFTDVIDGKDSVADDPKDAKDAPVFALTATEASLEDQRIDMLLMGDLSSDWGDLRTVSSEGISTAGSGGSGGVGNGGTGVSTPPIGAAVPEPSTLSLVGFLSAFALGIAYRFRKAAGVA